MINSYFALFLIFASQNSTKERETIRLTHAPLPHSPFPASLKTRLPPPRDTLCPAPVATAQATSPASRWALPAPIELFFLTVVFGKRDEGGETKASLTPFPSPLLVALSAPSSRARRFLSVRGGGRRPRPSARPLAAF